MSLKLQHTKEDILMALKLCKIHLLSRDAGLSEETCITIFCCKLTLEMDLDASNLTGITIRSTSDCFSEIHII